MSVPLSGKAVLVTGASAGIGRATVVALAQAGAKVIATGRRRMELDNLARECSAGAIETIAGDLNDARFVDDLAGKAGDVDILVNNAGILKYAPLMDMTDADVDAMFRTNVLSAFRIAHVVARSMMARRRGHIIIMTSIAAREVYPLGVIYCATKHALSAITRGLRLELQGHGIKVTEIAPGTVDTEIRATSDHPRVLEALKMRKYEALSSEEVAEAVVYAASAAPNCCPDLIELRPQGAA
jgi:3-hydroxy acid dehydrogenase / malonic semialdehyde reductase